MEGRYGSSSGELGDASNERITTVSSLVEVYERWAAKPRGRDPIIAKIAGALAETLRSDERLIYIAQEMIETHPMVPFNDIATNYRTTLGASPDIAGGTKLSYIPYPDYAANHLMRGFWDAWRKDENEGGWPERYIEPEVCRAGIKRVLGSDDKLAKLEFNVMYRPVQSTVSSRGAGPKMIMRANKSRFRRPVNIASIGHSLGLAERKLILGEPFDQVRLWDLIYADDKPLLRESQAAGLILNHETNRPLEIERCVAIDILPGDNDPAAREWAISCFTPREQMNKDFMNDVNRLASLRPDGYISLAGDFTAAQNVAPMIKELGSRKADYVILSTVLYQLSQQDRVAMLQNALDILSDDGMIILQDFVQARRSAYRDTPDSIESSLEQLYFPSDWEKWTYRTLVLDPARTGMEFEEALIFNDGRCGQVRLNYNYRQKLLGY